MQDFMIRAAEKGDLQALLELYIHLHDNPYPELDARIEDIWARIMGDRNHHILLGYVEQKLVASCVLVLVENLTHRQRPYALIENVITHPDYRKRGYGLRILSAAKEIAVENGCYKIMLMTGSKQENTLNFYRQAGYNSNDKTAFIQWL